MLMQSGEDAGKESATNACRASILPYRVDLPEYWADVACPRENHAEQQGCTRLGPVATPPVWF